MKVYIALCTDGCLKVSTELNHYPSPACLPSTCRRPGE